jgi:hypothetical protein
MDNATLEALRGSITKWENVLKGGPEKGEENCPLCVIFIDDDCDGCPVNDITESACSNNAWKKWVWHHNENHVDEPYHRTKYVECPRCKELAEQELDFLKSLLPEE